MFFFNFIYEEMKDDFYVIIFVFLDMNCKKFWNMFFIVRFKDEVVIYDELKE